MVKEKRILSYAIGYLLVGLFICLIGISDVFAATYYTDYGYSQQYYDNNGSTVTAVTTTWNESMQSYVSGSITTVANSYGAGLSITSPIPLIANHTYTLSIYFEDISNIALSSKNNIAIGTSLESARYNYANSSYWVDMVQSSVNNNSVLQFVFTATGAGNFIFIPWTTTTTTSQIYVLTQINMEDLGSEGISQEDINTSLNNQTSILNDYIENSTNTITGAITDTETNINTNIDDMEEEIKDTINDNFNTCRDSRNLFSLYNSTLENYNSSYIINNDNKITITNSGTWSRVYVTYSNLKPNTTYTVSTIITNNSGVFAGLLTRDEGATDDRFSINNTNNYKPVLKVISNNEGVINFQFYTNWSGNSNTSTLIFDEIQVEEGSNATSFEEPGEICQNKIDETNDKLDETNQNLNDIEGALTDSSPTDMSGLGDSAGWLPAGPVDSILTLPLTFFLNLSESLSSECRPVELTLPFVNKKIYLPCIRTLYDKMGVTGTIFTTAGVIASAVILYNYLLALYKWVDDTLTMRENTMPGYYDDNWGGGA